MSLDLYIKTSTPVIKRGTGVYVREDGKTKGSPAYLRGISYTKIMIFPF